MKPHAGVADAAPGKLGRLCGLKVACTPAIQSLITAFATLMRNQISESEKKIFTRKWTLPKLHAIFEQELAADHEGEEYPEGERFAQWTTEFAVAKALIDKAVSVSASSLADGDSDEEVEDADAGADAMRLLRSREGLFQ